MVKLRLLGSGNTDLMIRALTFIIYFLLNYSVQIQNVLINQPYYKNGPRANLTLTVLTQISLLNIPSSKMSDFIIVLAGGK